MANGISFSGMTEQDTIDDTALLAITNKDGKTRSIAWKVLRETLMRGYMLASKDAQLESIFQINIENDIYDISIISEGVLSFDYSKIPVGGSEVVIDLSPYQVPMKDGVAQKLIYSGATSDPVTGQWTFDKSINVPAGSINVGEAATLSEGGEDLLILGNVTGRRGFALAADFDETGSMTPDYVNLGPEFFNALQPVFADTNLINPLSFSITGGVTAPDIRQTNQVTFRCSSPMSNVTSRISDANTGVVIRYIPDKAAWDGMDGSTGLDFIAGDNVVDFISKEPDTLGVFNVGTVPFRLEQGQQIDVEIKADEMSLLGVQAGPTFFPYLTQMIQEGPKVLIATENYVDSSHETTVFKQLGTSSTNADYAINPQTIISEVFDLNYDKLKITLSFESSNTATNRSTVVGLFIDGVLQDSESVIEQKDDRNNTYQCKAIDYTLASGPHTIEVLFGRSNGGGGSLAQVGNVRVMLEELR